MPLIARAEKEPTSHMEKQRDYFLYVDKQKVPVSREVFEAARMFARKEHYFMEELKTEQFRSCQEKQTAVFLPPREVSLEYMLDEGEQFEDTESASPEDLLIKAELVKRLVMVINGLPEGERQLIVDYYYLGLNENELMRRYQEPPSTLRSRRNVILRKIRKGVEKFF